MNTRIFLLFITCISLTSCLEIEEKITVNKDKSGSLEIKVEPQQGNGLLNSITNIFNYKIKQDALVELEGYINKLKSKEGISNVSYQINSKSNNYSISFNFSSDKQLNKALYELAGVKYNIFSPKYIKIGKHKLKRRNLSPWIKTYLKREEDNTTALFAASIINYRFVVELPGKPKRIKPTTANTKTKDNTVETNYPLSKMLDKNFNSGLKVRY